MSWHRRYTVFKLMSKTLLPFGHFGIWFSDWFAFYFSTRMHLWLLLRWVEPETNRHVFHAESLRPWWCTDKKSPYWGFCPKYSDNSMTKNHKKTFDWLHLSRKENETGYWRLHTDTDAKKYKNINMTKIGLEFSFNKYSWLHLHL